MVNLRALAKGRACTVRLPLICNGDSATVVLAHVRLAGITGMGQKSPDALGAWCCSSCHFITEQKKASDMIQRAFLEGVIRTQYQLILEGVISW